MDEFLRRYLGGQNILLLGFGREGQSSYQVIRRLLPDQELTIADLNPQVAESPLITGDRHLKIHSGPDYLRNLNQFGIILKSPGIRLTGLRETPDRARITSQTDLFLQEFRSQVTGVTGTKGKSTTSSLIAHILKTAGKDTVLLGNIGTPAFHFLNRITPHTCIVFELSSHQLEYIQRAPHIAVLLNIYEEHLDAYPSFGDYQTSKMNIATLQEPDDLLIYDADDPLITKQMDQRALSQRCVPYSLEKTMEPGSFRRDGKLVFNLPGKEKMILNGWHNRYLKGEHNLRNILAAVSASLLLDAGEEAILDGLASFKGLTHRMEYIGYYHGIHWINDSIATIPEACMAALESLPGVDTVILGGFDRGIAYGKLAGFLIRSPVRTLIFTGAAGKRLGFEIEQLDHTIKTRKHLFYINRFEDLLPLALENTRQGTTCLLSPAAPSYDEFRSFEERGFRFRELITGIAGNKECRNAGK